MGSLERVALRPDRSLTNLGAGPFGPQVSGRQAPAMSRRFGRCNPHIDRSRPTAMRVSPQGQPRRPETSCTRFRYLLEVPHHEHARNLSRSSASRPDHGCADAGDDHAGARHHHRQRRAADHDGRSRRLAGQHQLGADLLHRRRRHHDAGHRLACRPLRPQGTVPDGGGRLHHLLHALRPGLEPRDHGAVPPDARRVRRRDRAAVADLPARHQPEGAPRPGDGHLGRRHHAGADPRPDAGRLADREFQLALGVLHQPAGRHPRLPRHGRLSAGRRQARARLRFLRLRHDLARRRRAAADARPRRRGRLVLLVRDLDRARSFAHRLLGVHHPHDDGRASLHRPQDLPRPQFRDRAGVHLRHGRADPRQHVAAAADAGRPSSATRPSPSAS